MTYLALALDFRLECPRCGKSKTVVVCDVVPLQRFDVKCCGGQVVTARVLSVTKTRTVREVTWASW